MKQKIFDGGFLSLMRERNDMTLQQLADAAGTSKSHIWELENSKKTEPSFALVYAMSRALGVKMELFAKDHR